MPCWRRLPADSAAGLWRSIRIPQPWLRGRYDFQRHGRDSSVFAIQPVELTDISRYSIGQIRTGRITAAMKNRYDMYLHGITGMINMGGYGYHYGQILCPTSPCWGLTDGHGTTSQHILLHEMGHGFGPPDYYGGEGEFDGLSPGGFPGETPL